MQQHPVPQNISSYEFKLVGDMTLKQFFQLAGGVVISLIFYATPLPGVIKWPLVVIFALIGAALAFLPIEERPLSSWVFAFFKAVYSPTLYNSDPKSAEEVFSKSSAVLPDSPAPLVNQTDGTTETVPEEIQKLEQQEKSFMSRITTLFSTTSQAVQASTKSPVSAQPQQHYPQPVPKSTPIAPQQSQVSQVPLGEVLSQNIQEEQANEFTTQPRSGPIFRIEEIGVPAQTSVKVGQTIPIQDAQPAPRPIANPILTPVFTSGTAASSSPLSQQAVFTPDAAPPSPPEIPNTIVGQVLTYNGKIVEGAILEIRDAPTKTPVRAIRTNKVGHFMTVTPLKDGDYEIMTEKEGLTFDQIKFTATGRLIPPIQVKAKE